MKLPTYAQAQERHMEGLRALGWHVSTRNAVTGAPLKYPHASSPDGNARLWFKAQAVYVSSGDNHDFGKARSLWFDIRKESTEALALSAIRYSEALGKLDAEYPS